MAKKLISFYASTDVKDALNELAKKEERSVSQEIDLLLKSILTEKGLIKK
jgi:hypothetical protein